MESHLTINCLALLAIHRALQALHSALSSWHIIVFTDNTTAMEHRNRQGGTPWSSLQVEAMDERNMLSSELCMSKENWMPQQVGSAATSETLGEGGREEVSPQEQVWLHSSYFLETNLYPALMPKQTSYIPEEEIIQPGELMPAPRSGQELCYLHFLLFPWHTYQPIYMEAAVILTVPQWPSCLWFSDLIEVSAAPSLPPQIHSRATWHFCTWLPGHWKVTFKQNRTLQWYEIYPTEVQKVFH